MKKKWRRILNVVLAVTIWSAVIAYVAYATVLTRRHRAEQTVERVDILVRDSTETGQLVTTRRVREWILRSGIGTIGVPIDEVDVGGIRSLIQKNGFVERVDVSVTYSGIMNIEVSQRRPMMRLMVDGYDAYVTEDGFIFESPDASALYVPVVTGPYRPITPPSYEGRMGDFIAERARESQERIREIGRDKIALYREEDTIRVRRTAERKRSVKKQWREDKEDFRKRVDELRRQKRAKLKYYDGMLRDIQSRIDAVTARQRAEALKQKKLEERYDDFLKLINFVKWLESDSFWSSEVVQIVARTSSSGRLEADLVPRSGNFRIVLGNLDDADRKMDKLMRFYRDGLSRIGWDRYRIINVKYENQVVCTE